MRILSSVLVLACAFALAACQTTNSLNVFPGGSFTEEDKACIERAPAVTLCGHQVPVYEWYDEPIYETQRTPVYGQETVPVYRIRKRPVTWPTKDYCTGCEGEKCLWTVNERVQVGVRRVDTCIGYKEKRVCVGTCRKRRIVGWRTVEPPPCQCPPEPSDPCAKYPVTRRATAPRGRAPCRSDRRRR